MFIIWSWVQWCYHISRLETISNYKVIPCFHMQANRHRQTEMDGYIQTHTHACMHARRHACSYTTHMHAHVRTHTHAQARACAHVRSVQAFAVLVSFFRQQTMAAAKVTDFTIRDLLEPSKPDAFGFIIIIVLLVASESRKQAWHMSDDISSDFALTMCHISYYTIDLK